MRPNLIPAKLKLRGKTHNVIFVWNETWGFTDDFFFVWEKNQFKPYFRNRIYTLDGAELYPHYHYSPDTFKEALNEFLTAIPLTRVVIQGRACYLIADFKDEYWAFDPVSNQVVFTTVMPKKSSVPFKEELIRQKLAEFVMNGISQRVNFAQSHLLHLEIMDMNGCERC
jgi:hypothetical protein